MKKIILVIFALVAIGSAFSQQLGTPTPLQRILNELPAIPVAGRNLKFQFGGNTWVATVNGENALAGTVEIVDINGGSILTLNQTHIWAGAVGRAAGGLFGGALGGAIGNAASTWVATPGPEIVLDYNTTGSRATLSLASEARITEARAAGANMTAGANTTAISPATVAAPPMIPAASAGFVNPIISGYSVVVNGMQTGPYDESGLRALVSQKQLTKDTLVWKEGMSNWIIAGAVEELAPLFSTASARSRSMSGSQQNALNFSIGGGAYFAGFFGGGIESTIYNAGQSTKLSIPMPYFGGGGFVFLDATYIEISLGVSYSGGEWEIKVGPPYNQANKWGNTEFLNIDIGVLGKFPFTINPNVKVFPLVGFDYAIVPSAKIQGVDDPEPTDWNHFILEFGGGLDYSINDSLYFRIEALYGLQFPSKAESYFRFSASGWNATTPVSLNENGFTAKLGLGYKF